MKSPEGYIPETFLALLDDLVLHHPHIRKDMRLDRLTAVKRLNNEGVSFVTQTLPKLGKAIYRSFQTGSLVTPEGFAIAKGTALPRFLGGLLKCVYERDGRLRADADTVVITDLVQLCFLCYKAAVPCSPVKVKRAYDNFVAIEAELSTLRLEVDEVLELARELVTEVMGTSDPQEILPQHGPGAVATGETTWTKWYFGHFVPELHEKYPYWEYFVPSWKAAIDQVPWYKTLQRQKAVARLFDVPKDSRGPRLISMEPLEVQFIQQGQKKLLYNVIESAPLTRGLVNFTDQGINRVVAKRSSLTGEYATLDMKEASDRVSTALVEILFEGTPWKDCLLATRSSATLLPDGTELPLWKFAPMGSAVCFPVEALCFWALAESIRRQTGIAGQVYVFGDDILVPTALAAHLFERFPKYGLKFNEDKCFTRGPFRESCGCDAYLGIEIQPVRMKELCPKDHREALPLASSLEFSNNLYLRGYWRAAKAVERHIDSVVDVVSFRSPSALPDGGLEFVSFLTKGRGLRRETLQRTASRFNVQPRLRWNADLQRTEVLRASLVPVKEQDLLGDYPRLFRALCGKTSLLGPQSGVDNCEDSWQRKNALPRKAVLKRTWGVLPALQDLIFLAKGRSAGRTHLGVKVVSDNRFRSNFSDLRRLSQGCLWSGIGHLTF